MAITTLDWDLTPAVRAAATGDSEAYARLVEASRNAVTSIALAICRDVAASEDVAQEVYLVAWRRLPELRNPASFLPWIRQITRYSARTWLRDHRSAGRSTPDVNVDALVAAAVDPQPGPESALLDREREKIVQEALESLPDEAREVVILFHREGCSTQQVARLLDLNDAAIRKRLQRARQALRQDVFNRFADVARKTAPSAAFTAAVLAATASAPVASATVLAASALSPKSLSAKLVTLLGGVGLGFLGGAAGVILGLRCDFQQAVDAWERQQLRALRNTALLAVLFTCLGFALPVTAKHWILPVSIFGLLVLSLAGIYLIWLPRILRHRFTVLENGDEARVRLRLRQRFKQAFLGWLAGALAGGLGLWAGLHGVVV